MVACAVSNSAHRHHRGIAEKSLKPFDDVRGDKDILRPRPASEMADEISASESLQ